MKFVFLAAAVLILQWHSVSQSPAKQPSAKPGINDTWKTDKIEPLVQMLESESREIFHEREHLAGIVGVRPGSAVADVGAGSGFMTLLFAKQVGPSGRIFAVDINQTLLDSILARAKKEGISNIQPIVAKDDSAELAPNSVDLVFICDTYHHFEFPESTMRSIHRALRPGGQLVIVDFKRIPGVTAERMLEHVRAGEDVFTREITSFGFELTNVHAPPWLKENYILRFRRIP
jgi:predicted methyltransferase